MLRWTVEGIGVLLVKVKSKILVACRIRLMKVGIGLPATIPDAPPELVLEWAKRADSKGFSSLGIIDRLVYPNLEPIVTLALGRPSQTYAP
jgi:hypothetical protein